MSTNTLTYILSGVIISAGLIVERDCKLKNSFKYAFKASLPVLAGYMALGIGFGVLLESKGYSILWAGLMALTMYSGSLQYAAVDFMSSGATLLTTTVMTIFIQARHFFYGFSLLDRYKGMGNAKPYMIFGLTDETYSLVCTGKVPEGVNKKKYFLFLTALHQSYWITGCMTGALLGSVLPFELKGVDYAMTALFIVIFVDQWKSQKNHIPAIVGVVSTIVCLLIFGSESFIIPSMAVITIVFALFRKKLEGGKNND